MNCNIMCKRLLTALLLLFLALTHPTDVYAKEEKYLVYEQLYAFLEPETLMDEIDAVRQEGNAVILGVMPVYQNLHYPAMEEFLEVLRYEQASGCRILLHFPFVQSDTADIGKIVEIVRSAVSFYVEKGIDIRGILYTEESEKYEQALQFLENDYLLFHLDSDDFWWENGEDTVWYVLETDLLPEREYRYQPQMIPETADFHIEAEEPAGVSLNGMNRVLLFLVTVSILIFIAFMIYARRRNRMFFLKQQDEKEDTGRNK